MGDLGNQVSQFEASGVQQQNGGNSRLQPRSVNPNDRGNRAQHLGIAISPQLKQESQYNPVKKVIIMQQQQLYQHQDQRQDQQQQQQQQPQMHGNSAQMSQNDAANSNIGTSNINFQHIQHPTQEQVPQNIQIQSLTNGTMPPPQNVPVGGTGSMQVQVARKGRFSIIKDVDVTQQPSVASNNNTNGMAMTMDDGTIHVQIQQPNQGMPSHGSIVSVMTHQHSAQQQQQHQQQQQQHQQQQQQQQQPKSISQISAISRGATSASVPSSRVIKSVMSSPPASGLEVKGRFLVTKSKDGHNAQNHVRSHSMGATLEQYQQSMASILSVKTNEQQQMQSPIAVPQHQQKSHARSLSDGQLLQIPIEGQSPVGLKTPVVYSTPTPADNGPLIQPMSSKPPKVPKPMTATGNTPGGSGVSGGVGKMYHFLDQLKIEVVEADKMVKSLKGDVKFLVSSQSAILGLRYSIRYRMDPLVDISRLI